jgi:hypothetical protein
LDVFSIAAGQAVTGGKVMEKALQPATVFVG